MLHMFSYLKFQASTHRLSLFFLGRSKFDRAITTQVAQDRGRHEVYEVGSAGI